MGWTVEWVEVPKHDARCRPNAELQEDHDWVITEA
jgi:hypothetical protein